MSFTEAAVVAYFAGSALCVAAMEDPHKAELTRPERLLVPSSPPPLDGPDSDVRKALDVYVGARQITPTGLLWATPGDPEPGDSLSLERWADSQGLSEVDRMRRTPDECEAAALSAAVKAGWLTEPSDLMRARFSDVTPGAPFFDLVSGSGRPPLAYLHVVVKANGAATATRLKPDGSSTPVEDEHHGAALFDQEGRLSTGDWVELGRFAGGLLPPGGWEKLMEVGGIVFGGETHRVTDAPDLPQATALLGRGINTVANPQNAAMYVPGPRIAGPDLVLRGLASLWSDKQSRLRNDR